MYVYTHDVPISFEAYERIVGALGPAPLTGSLLHLCVQRPDGGLRYIEVWESEAACTKAFDERIHPAVAQAFGGSLPPGEHVTQHLGVLHASGSWMADAAPTEIWPTRA